MAKKRKRNLTPDEVEKIREALLEVQRDLREMLAFLQSKVGQKPA
jgi:hypothetical protein